MAPPNGAASPVYTLGDDTVLQDGMKVVIYNPEYKKTLSGVYDGHYNTGTDITIDGTTISGFSTNDVWTVSDNSDGTWSFAYEGQKIGMGDEFSSMPLGEKHNTWTMEAASDGLYYVKNVGRNVYMEWYASNNNWSGYWKISPGSEGMFALGFYDVSDVEVPTPPTPEGPDLPFENGDTVVIYNVGATGVLAGQDDNVTSPSVNNAAATVSGTTATPANGGRVFTVEQNGEWWRFKTAHDGYLCSNGTGSNSFYSQDASDDRLYSGEPYRQIQG